MKERTQNNTNTSSKNKNIIVVTIVVIVILLSGWWALTQFFGGPYHSPDVPHPLGEKLEYIGKEDYGCTGFCDSKPSSTYYYATDMSIDEVIHYFKRVTIESDQDIHSTSDPSIPRTFSLKSPKGDVFYITYYINGQEYIDKSKSEFQNTNKRQHILTVLDEQYTAAKDSL
jgi:hypothetical protein